MRFADIAAVMPVQQSTLAARQQAERAVDPNALAQKGAIPTAKGQLTAEAITSTPEMHKATRTDKDKRERNKRRRHDDVPQGPLAKLFAVDEADDSTFESDF
jgi:hypothetical protein